MPIYTVTTLEKHLRVCTFNDIEADSPEEAAEIVRDGDVAYDHATTADDPGEVIEVLSVEEDEP